MQYLLYIKSFSSCSFVFWVLKVVFSIRVLLPFWMFHPNNVKNTLSESPWKGQGDSQFAKPTEWRSAMTSTMADKYRSWIKEETTNLLKRYAVAMDIPSRSFNLCVWCVQHRSPMPPAFSSRTSLLPQHGCSRAMVGFCSQFACSVVGVHAFRKQRLVFFHTQLFLTGSKVHMKCNWWSQGLWRQHQRVYIQKFLCFFHFPKSVHVARWKIRWSNPSVIIFRKLLRLRGGSTCQVD